MAPPLLQLVDITKSFGTVRALRGVSFELSSGEVHALIGENGAGKSTLIKIATGAHAADKGALHLYGRRVEHLSPASAQALGIAAIYQQPALFPDLSVAENMALRLEPLGRWRRVRWADRRRRALELLSRVGASIDPETEVRHLSMPEQQLVEIAGALGAGARILIMDEPTASLTAREVELLLRTVRQLRSQGVGIIYISHRLEEIFDVADRVTVLRDGQTVGTRPLQSAEAGAAEPGLMKKELVQMMIGRELTAIFPPAAGKPGGVRLSLQGIGCRAARVHDVHLEVRRGEIVGLAGLVGAGRTELARVLFGIAPADAGILKLDDKELRIRSPREAVEAGLAYVPEDRRKHGVIVEMSVAENMTMAVHPTLFPYGWLRARQEQAVANRYIRELSIKTPSPATSAGDLSGGNQQKVALARWLATQPRVLILDEPTQGIDVGAKAEIHRLIREMAAQGLAVLMISSDLSEIMGMCDRIAVVRDGTVRQVFDGDQVDAHTIMTSALGQQ